MKCASYYAKSIEIPALSRLVSRIFPARLVNIHLDTIDRECNRAYRLASLSQIRNSDRYFFLLPLSLSLEHLDRSKKRYLEKTGRGDILALLAGKNSRERARRYRRYRPPESKLVACGEKVARVSVGPSERDE